jgi:hypothetical protein
MKKLNESSSPTVFKKFHTDLLLGSHMNQTFDNDIELSVHSITHLNKGRNMTDEIMELFVLDFLTKNSEDYSDYMIITEKYLSDKFTQGKEISEDDIHYLFVIIINFDFLEFRPVRKEIYFDPDNDSDWRVEFSCY